MLTSQVFVELARHLTEPTRHEILTGIWLPDNMFGVSFGTLLSAVTTLEKGQAPYAEMLAFAEKFLQTICRRDKLMYFIHPSFSLRRGNWLTDWLNMNHQRPNLFFIPVPSTLSQRKGISQDRLYIFYSHSPGINSATYNLPSKLWPPTFFSCWRHHRLEKAPIP